MQEFLYDIVKNGYFEESSRLFTMFSIIAVLSLVTLFIIDRLESRYPYSINRSSSIDGVPIVALIVSAAFAATQFSVRSAAENVLRHDDLTNRIAITSQQKISLEEAMNDGLKIYDLEYDYLSSAKLRFSDEASLETDVFIIERGDKVEIYQTKTRKSVTISQSELYQYLRE